MTLSTGVLPAHTRPSHHTINPLDSKGNYSATSKNAKLVHWPLMDGWAVTFGTARRGLGGLWPRPVPSSLYQKQPTHQWPVHRSLSCYMMVRCSAVLMWQLKG